MEICPLDDRYKEKISSLLPIFLLLIHDTVYLLNVYF